MERGNHAVASLLYLRSPIQRTHCSAAPGHSKWNVVMQSAGIDGRKRALDVLVIVAEDSKEEARRKLVASLGDENASRLHYAFVRDLDEQFGGAESVGAYDVYWALPTDSGLLGLSVVSDTPTLAQRGDGVTERRFNICRDIAAQGYQRLIILIAEFPHLPVAIVGRGFEGLDHRDVVIGPGNHCGYYLVGVHLYPEAPNLFGGIEMDTSSVLAQTLVRAADLDCSVALLTSTFDSGDMEDPHRLLEVLREAGNGSGPRTAIELVRLMDTQDADRRG